MAKPKRRGLKMVQDNSASRAGNENGIPFRAWMEPYQRRVVIELNELKTKHEALEKFICNGNGEGSFNRLPEIERDLLKTQLGAMGLYIGALDARINGWEVRQKKFMLVPNHALGEARRMGVWACIELIQRRLSNYVEEHGKTDPGTGVTEFTLPGEEYVGELGQIIEILKKALDAPEDAG